MGTEGSVLVDRESWVLHQGQHILRHDYSGLHGAQLIETLNNHKDAVISRNQRELATLLVMKNTIVDKQVIAAFKQAWLRVKPYCKKTAIVGYHGVQKFFIQIVTKFVGMTPGLFDTEEEALNWLVE